MSETKKTKFVLIGGFLGAGKTTLIGQLASRFLSRGLRVGIVTNDQADDLVDTRNLRSQGYDVGEVAGACFCCSFDNLVETAGRLGGSQAPDILLAEPVGSCTDLVATVILPLQELLGDQFELAPFGVLLKPSHGRRILTQDDSRRSGFSPQAEYIFRKQLEEADYLMIGRRDEMTETQIKELQDALATIDDSVPTIAVSPRDGDGIEEVMKMILSPMVAGRRLLEIDYDIYADGEAELGWVNLSANLKASSPIDLDGLVKELVSAIASDIVLQQDAQIAHLKASVMGGDAQSVANVVSNDSPVEVGLASGRKVEGDLQIIVNARVAIDPSQLEEICRQHVVDLAKKRKLDVETISAFALRPGRPTPTHRVKGEG